uniref:Uncharacterized protein n=1 Tax=Siphoviridae sp. ctoic9 TaxID=2825671 RepID=A0A8S5Q9U9_9CAUD|nr:MAG TPA: hypothetical protein [Siphoviridae sp. ctoic9]
MDDSPQSPMTAVLLQPITPLTSPLPHPSR